MAARGFAPRAQGFQHKPLSTFTAVTVEASITVTECAAAARQCAGACLRRSMANVSTVN